MPYPQDVQPMLAGFAAEPFDSEAHLFEVKWDGVRTLAWVEDGRVRLRSRTLRETTHQFPELAALAGQIQAPAALLDGEIVSFTEAGLPSFGQLQNRLGFNPGNAGLGTKRAGIPIVYQVFDILYRGDESLLRRPLAERKAILAEVLPPGDFAVAPDWIVGRGIDYYAAVSQMGLEGMVAKEVESLYLPGRRTKAWLKFKVNRHAHFAVVGVTRGEGSRGTSFGSLVLALHDAAGAWRYVGQVGGGFNDRELARLRPLVEARRRDTTPLTAPPRIDKLAHWVEPGLVARVRYAELTDQDRLRFPVYEGLVDGVPLAACSFAALTSA